MKIKSRMSKCKKVKNPCKICLGPVTKKTGLQCQGACKCWVHYSCGNYTPGKIKDIKAGIIKVTCPCPDCKSTLPKEFRIDEPFSCSNLKCPAYQPPKCCNKVCPTNKDAPDKMNQTSVQNVPFSNCGVDCKKHSHPKSLDSSDLSQMEPRHPNLDPQNQSDASLSSQDCTSGGSSSQDVSGDHEQIPMDGLPSFGTLEKMCNTVAELTDHINSLMNKMKQVVQDRNSGAGCDRKCCTQGPKSMCPKPCFCPGNPGNK